MRNLLPACTLAILAAACNAPSNPSNLQAKIDSLENELQSYRAEKALVDQHLTRFDSLDFVFYSNQQWPDFAISHAHDIVAHYPDGSKTTGLAPQHIDMLKPMFVFAPDTKIKQHPVRFGSGEWTAVIGEMEGTFSAPMPIGNGKSIPPTGKKFKLSMATIGKWKDGKMTEEYLFWDNQAFMQQIGLGQK
ncbi:ester cyclase [Chitinophaga caseinilytica]|uniref:ester cyclase n=1 Tax=Chitinophaga caseinilytica TaxID=2267521 RepID=UPI003C2AB5C9